MIFTLYLLPDCFTWHLALVVNEKDKKTFAIDYTFHHQQREDTIYDGCSDSSIDVPVNDDRTYDELLNWLDENYAPKDFSICSNNCSSIIIDVLEKFTDINFSHADCFTCVPVLCCIWLPWFSKHNPRLVFNHVEKYLLQQADEDSRLKSGLVTKRYS